MFRHSFPRLFIAFFWYLVGQSLESSTIMLEIAFEHRNYLPAALIFYPMASSLVNTPILRKSIKIAIGGSLVSLMLALTAQQATLWGNPRLQAKMWEINIVRSNRTIFYQNSKSTTIEEVKSSLERTIALQKSNEQDIDLAMIRISIECRLGEASEDAWTYAIKSAVSNKKMSAGNADWLNNATAFTLEKKCDILSKAKLELWLKQLLNNQYRIRNPNSKAPILNILGNLELVHGNSKAALTYYNQAVDVKPDYELVLTQAASLGNSGHEHEGLAHIAHFRRIGVRNKVTELGMPRIHQWLLTRTGYMERELNQLELALQSGSNDEN